MAKVVNRTPERAIRAKCLDCCCQVREEVENCTISDCPLFQYRLGNADITSSTVSKTKRKRIVKAAV